MGTILRALIDGFGNIILPFYHDIIPFAGSIFILLITFEILKEAIDISTGKGINLASKLLTIFFVGTVLLGYGKLSTGIYRAAADIGDTVISEFGNINKNIEESYVEGSKRHEAALEKNGDEAGFFEGLFIGLVTAILSGICLMIMFFIMILILVLIAGAYASLALVLAIGPVFAAMLVSREFRSIGIKWTLIVLSYLLVIPVYIMVMRMMIDLFGQNAYGGNMFRPSSVSVSASVEQMILLMAGPLISLGLVFSVSKIVDRIIGSAGNMGETALAVGASVAVASRSVLKGAAASVKSIGKSGKNLSGIVKRGRFSGGKKQGSGNGGGKRKNGNDMRGSKKDSGGYSSFANPPRISEKTSNINDKNGTGTSSDSQRSGLKKRKSRSERRMGDRINQRSNDPKISKTGSFVTEIIPEEEKQDE